MIEPSPDVTVRFRLDRLLDEVGMSQSELARRCGISFVTINAIFKNRTKQVSLATLDAIANALKVEPGELIGRDEKKRAKRAS